METLPGIIADQFHIVRGHGCAVGRDDVHLRKIALAFSQADEPILARAIAVRDDADILGVVADRYLTVTASIVIERIVRRGETRLIEELHIALTLENARCRGSRHDIRRAEIRVTERNSAPIINMLAQVAPSIERTRA